MDGYIYVYIVNYTLHIFFFLERGGGGGGGVAKERFLLQLNSYIDVSVFFS